MKIILLLLLLSSIASADIIPLQRTSRRRRLKDIYLESDDVFFTEITTSSQGAFSVIVDTGSSITALPCSTCQNCGLHKKYNLLQKTFTYFRQCYAEGSCLRGVKVLEEVCMDKYCRSIELGCCSYYPPLFKMQEADGIIGLGGFLKDNFSIYFSKENALLTINEDRVSDIEYDLVRKGDLLYIRTDKGDVLFDSGTSYSSLPYNSTLGKLFPSKKSSSHGNYVLGVDYLMGYEVIVKNNKIGFKYISSM